MRHARVWVAGLWLACALTPAGAAPGTAAAAADGPSDVVQVAAQGILTELAKDRDAYRRDPAKMQQLVASYLLPHFDTARAARAVLGAHWRTATPEQREHFVDAFYHSLLRNYGSALTEFSAERLKVFPTQVRDDATRATVRTEVKRENGERVAVNYTLYRTPQGWKAADVAIDGISYVNSYRTDFGEQIEAQGIEAVIRRLESGEKPGALGPQTRGQG